MKMTRKRLIALGLSTIMAATGLTGCGNGSETASNEQPSDESQPAQANSGSQAEDSSSSGEGSSAEGDSGSEETGEAASYTDYSAGFPERVTIQIPVYDRGYEGWNVTDNYYTRWIQQEFGEKYNVNVEYVGINRTNEVQDFMQLIAAHTAPDIIFHYDMPQAVAYYSEDTMQDIDYDELAFYAPTFYENTKAADDIYGKLDGHNAFFFAERNPIYYSYVTLIRKDWCDKVNMDIPTTWEELNEVAKAWKDAGLGVIGDTLITKSFTYMASWIDPNVSQEELALYFDLNVAPFTWEATKNFLKARNEQYNEGIYDSEFYLVENEAAAKAKFVSGETGTFSCYMAAGMDVFTNLLANDPEAEVATMGTAYPSAEGFQSNYYKYPPYGMIMGISTDTPDIERAAVYMFLEWMWQPENLTFLKYGIEGETYTVDADGIRLRNSEYDGEAMLAQNNNKDYWCLVQEVDGYGSEEKDLIANKVNLAPAGYDYLIQDQFDYAKSREKNGLVIPVFTRSIPSASEYKADLAALWKEAYVDCITCTTEEFEAKYAEWCEEYLDAGYQDILDEKQALIDAGDVIYAE